MVFNFAVNKKITDMDKEKAFQILDNLTINKLWTLSLSRTDYGYLDNEKDVVCFSHASSTDENVKRVKEVIDKLAEDLLGAGKEYERFIMIIEYNANELMMNELSLIHEFDVEFIKKKKLSWGLAKHDGVERLRITLVASR